MIELRPFTRNDIPAMFKIAKEHEPFAEFVGPEQAVASLLRQEGWVFCENGVVVGHVTLSDFRVLHSVLLHATIIPACRGKCISARALRTIFGRLFDPDSLDLVKVYAYAVMGKTYQAARTLDDLGFSREGVDRHGLVLPDGRMFDILKYAMLREECPWIRTKAEIRAWLAGRRNEPR